MFKKNRLRKITLLIGDIVLLYFSLFLALTIRYGSVPSPVLWSVHKWPFFFVNLLWILIFYVADFYEIQKFISASTLRARVFGTMSIAALITIILFYFVPSFLITPKTNLIVDAMLASIFIWLWRKAMFDIAIKSSKITIYFLSKEKESLSFSDFIKERPQLGYEITGYPAVADVIIVSREAKQNSDFVERLYELILQGKTIIDFDKFYESITGKIPVSAIGKIWFLENLVEKSKQTFEKIKRWIDILLALILFLPYLIITPFVALIIKMNSKGPVFYRQARVGRGEKIFQIIKFRSMVFDAEKNGAQWAKEGDKRITFIGNILRKTRIDELPQLWNVLKGDLSFVGPRPERPEFVEQLKNQVPHYLMRHIIKPGLSGWAQINFPYGASVEDATEKLQYDLYYVKNRSLLLEISILLKTTMTVLQRAGR
jgi:exopolysaccharide biosynthesis polyprenyl glycosylphosphotransferase